MSVSSRTNVRAILANPTSEQATIEEKPMWIKLIQFNPTNLDNRQAIKGNIVLYGISNEEKTENMLDLMQELYGDHGENINFYFVDRDDNPSVTSMHGINQFPALIFFMAGMQLKKNVGEISSEIFSLKISDFSKKIEWIADRIDINWTGQNIQFEKGSYVIDDVDNISWSGQNIQFSNGSYVIEDI